MNAHDEFYTHKAILTKTFEYGIIGFELRDYIDKGALVQINPNLCRQSRSQWADNGYYILYQDKEFFVPKEYIALIL